jgi:hypothetical protein
MTWSWGEYHAAAVEAVEATEAKGDEFMEAMFGDPDVDAVTTALWKLGVLGTHDAKVHARAAVNAMRRLLREEDQS